MRTRALATVVAAAVLALSETAAADDGWSFRLTTPRGEVIDDADALLVAIPAGRAWGIAGGLRRLPAAGTTVGADIAVTDPRVREAFLRVAYYDRGTGRPRQVETRDSELVPSGPSAHVQVRLEPPEGATWYRVRVLGRLFPGALASGRAAIVAHDVALDRDPSAEPPPHARRTRLVPAD